MARWTGTWMSGLAAAGVAQGVEGDWRGKRYGLPQHGPGSVATFNARLGAVVVDAVVAGLIGGLVGVVVRNPGWQAREGADIAALVLMYALLLPTAGQTFGMRLFRIRVARLSGGLLRVPQALLRGILVSMILPALFTDKDGRGLHDKVVGSVVLKV